VIQSHFASFRVFYSLFPEQAPVSIKIEYTQKLLNASVKPT
jgi:hypothetical protein